MDAVIVNPLTDAGPENDLFMGPLYLGTALDRAGLKVKIIDSQVEDAKKELEKCVRKASCVGFSVMTAQVRHALELSDFVKGIDPEIPVVWGGVHPTLFPSQTIEDKSVDYLVNGEGEITFLELVKHLKGKGKLESIKGLVYEKGGEARINPTRPFIDLNELSPPSWHLLKMERYIRDYIVGDMNFGKFLPVHSGRGCVYRCTFCINTLNRKWRPLSAKNMFEESMKLKERHRLDYIKFVDENLFIDKKRVKEFCEMLVMEKADISWHGSGMRADYINQNHMDDEMMRLVKKSGCKVISMGIESGSQRVLDMIKKDIKVEHVTHAVRKCGELEMMPICSFMIGMPDEEKEDMLNTLSLIREIKRINPDTYVIGPQVFRPYPGAELYRRAKELGFEEPGSLREWAGVDMSGYTSVKDLPWVSDPQFVENIYFYLNRAQYKPSGSIRSILEHAFFKPLANFRLDHNMYGMAFDKKIFELIKKTHIVRSRKAVKGESDG